MAKKIKSARLRGSNQLISETQGRLESECGNRRAHGRFVKCSIGRGRFKAVVAYTIRQKIEGKFRVVGSGFNLEGAEMFIETGKRNVWDKLEGGE